MNYTASYGNTKQQKSKHAGIQAAAGSRAFRKRHETRGYWQGSWRHKRSCQPMAFQLSEEWTRCPPIQEDRKKALQTCRWTIGWTSWASQPGSWAFLICLGFLDTSAHCVTCLAQIRHQILPDQSEPNPEKNWLDLPEAGCACSSTRWGSQRKMASGKVAWNKKKSPWRRPDNNFCRRVGMLSLAVRMPHICAQRGNSEYRINHSKERTWFRFSGICSLILRETFCGVGWLSNSQE